MEILHQSFEVRRTEALHKLEQKGIRILSSQEISSMSSHFQQEMRAGIESNSIDPQGIKMYRSHIMPRPEGQLLPMGSTVLIAEVGGTNAYAALAHADEQGNVKIMTTDDGQKLLIKSPLRERSANGKREYTGPDDFFGELINKMDGLLKNVPQIDAIGVVYSFPGNAVQTAHGIDVISSEALPKDFDIPGISKNTVLIDGVETVQDRLIGESLVYALCQKYPDILIDPYIPIMVGNDTVAVALSKAGSKLGGVIGTGFNSAVATNVDGQMQYLNTEAGASVSVPETEIFRQLGGSNEKRNENPAERQISGISLGNYLDKSAEYLIKEGILPRRADVNDGDSKMPKTLGPESVTAAIDNDKYALSEAFVRLLTDKEFAVLKDVAQIIADRSAQIAGTMIGTMVNTFTSAFSEDSLFIPIEGSIFWKIPQYREKVAVFAHAIAPNKTFVFGEAAPEQAGIMGMGAAALGRLSIRISASIMNQQEDRIHDAHADITSIYMFRDFSRRQHRAPFD